MGKASERKEFLPVTESMRQGVVWGGELLRHPEVAHTSLTHGIFNQRRAANQGMSPAGQLADAFDRMTDKIKPEEVTPAAWSEGFMAALENQKFLQLLRGISETGNKVFWASKDPVSSAMFNGNARLADDDPISQAIVRAHRKLVADPEGPGWTTLALFCLFRLSAFNAKRGYDGDHWTELTLLWIEIDARLHEGDGASVAKLFVKLDKEYIRGGLAEMVGGKMMHGLAEAAINANETTLFH